MAWGLWDGVYDLDLEVYLNFWQGLHKGAGRVLGCIGYATTDLKTCLRMGIADKPTTLDNPKQFSLTVDTGTTLQTCVQSHGDLKHKCLNQTKPDANCAAQQWCCTSADESHCSIFYMLRMSMATLRKDLGNLSQNSLVIPSNTSLLTKLSSLGSALSAQ